MSQRTRARTTGDATTRRNKAAPQAEPAQTAATPQTFPAAQTGDSQREGQASTPPPGHQIAAAASGAFAPETLARTLRAVAAELERDPDLARRVARAVEEPHAQAPVAPADASLTASDVSQSANAPADAPEQAVGEATAKGKRAARTFRPRLVTGMSPDLGQGVIDPFALYAKRGEDGLRVALDELRLGSLRAIMREYQIDPSGKIAQQNDAEKLRAAILKAARKRRT